jgi:cell division septation protein DedD
MNVRKFELKLGSVQLILLSTIFILSLATAYYFGFTSGRTTGHKKALAASLAASPKTPLSPEEPAANLSTAEIYARLNESPSAPPEEELKIIETLELEEPKSEVASVTLGDLVAESPSKEDLKPLSLEPTQLPTEKPTERPIEIPTTRPTEKPTVIPTAKPTQKPTEKPVEKSSIQSGWFVQVAAPEDRATANRLVEKLRQNGFRASIEVAVIREQQYYRVLVGPEPSKELADRLLKQVARETYLQGTPFLKFIK